MHIVRRTVALCLATAAVTVPTLSGGAAHATYEPGEPELTWGRQVDTDYVESFADVATWDDIVWAVGSRTIDHGPYSQAVIERYDADGRKLSRLADEGDELHNSASSVDAGPWGAVVGGVHDLDLGYVQRLDADGTVLWTTELSDSDASVNDVAVVGDTIYAVGSVHGQFGQFSVDTFSLETGEPGVSRTFGDQGNLSSVVALGDRVVVGGFTATEVVEGERQGDYDNVLYSLDADDLSTVWGHQFGTVALDFIADLAVYDGTIYWAGTLGNEDMSNSFSSLVGGLGAVSASGDFLWRENLGPGYAVIRAMTATSEGLVVGGEVKPGQLGAEVSSYGDEDAFIQGRAFTGETLWTEVYGTSRYDGFSALAADGDRLFVGGFASRALFPHDDTPDLGIDAIVARLDVPHLQRPDLSARSGKGRFVGDNRYGTSKALRVVVPRGDARDVVVRLEDDGLIGDRLSLSSCTGIKHVRLAFRQGRRDVTSQTRKGTFRTRHLKPGTGQQLKLQVTATRKARGVATCVLTTRSGKRAGAVDRVRLRIVVAKRR